MISKGNSGKGPNCSRIDMEGATINSGYHSGREKNREKNEKASSSDLEGCKGTDRSYNTASGTIKLTEDTYNLGALSGSSTERSGTVDKENKGKSQTSSSVPNKLPHQGSNVSGTRGSFNAGYSLKDIPTESFKVKDQHSKIKKQGAEINSDACPGIADAKGCSGTDQSFNALSHGEVIINRGKLNTGACSGNTDSTSHS